MRWLKSVALEVLGLFVEDGSFAIAILAWTAFMVFVLAHVTRQASWTGPALFSGLAFVLIESVVRFSRRRTK
jgi:hypothetical protein